MPNKNCIILVRLSERNRLVLRRFSKTRGKTIFIFMVKIKIGQVSQTFTVNLHLNNSTVRRATPTYLTCFQFLVRPVTYLYLYSINAINNVYLTIIYFRVCRQSVQFIFIRSFNQASLLSESFFIHMWRRIDKILSDWLLSSLTFPHLVTNFDVNIMCSNIVLQLSLV